MSRGELFVVSEGEIPKDLSNAFFKLINSWEKITMVKIPSEEWENTELLVEKSETKRDIELRESNKDILTMWLVRKKSDIEIVNKISKRMNSLAIMIGNEVEIDPNIKCSYLQIDENRDIVRQLMNFDLPQKREMWRLARERRIEKRKMGGASVDFIRG